jgi:hypothetical protein
LRQTPQEPLEIVDDDQDIGKQEETPAVLGDDPKEEAPAATIASAGSAGPQPKEEPSPVAMPMDVDEKVADWAIDEDEVKSVALVPCPHCNEDLKSEGYVKCPYCYNRLVKPEEGDLLPGETEAEREFRTRAEDLADAAAAEQLTHNYAVPAQVNLRRPVTRSVRAREMRWTKKAEKRARKMGFEDAADRVNRDPRLKESLTAHYGNDLMSGGPKAPPVPPVAKAAAALAAAILATRPSGSAGSELMAGDRQGSVADFRPELAETVVSIGLLLMCMFTISLVGCMCGCLFCPCCRIATRIFIRMLLRAMEGDLQHTMVRDVCLQSQTTYTWSSGAPSFLAGNQGFGAAGMVEVGSVRDVRRLHGD